MIIPSRIGIGFLQSPFLRYAIAKFQELDAKIQQLRSSMEADQQSVQDAEKWIELIRKYTNITELSADLLNALIEKVVVHEATKNADGSRMQEVEIYYRFIGKIE